MRFETFDQSNCDKDFKKYITSVEGKLRNNRNLLAPLCIDSKRLKNCTLTDITDFINRLTADVYFFVIPEAKSKTLSINDISSILNNTNYKRVAIATSAYPKHFNDLEKFLKIYA